MKVYTYYEDINFEHQDRLLNLWKKSWQTHGFDAIVLNRSHAEAHSQYETFVQELTNIHQQVANKPLSKYGLSCWLRWLAYSTQVDEKFYVCDYDVINHNLSPTEPSDVLHLLDGDCPCIASGTSSQFNKLCEEFISVPKNNIKEFISTYKQINFVHYHDQEFFRISNVLRCFEVQATRRREEFFGIPGEGEFWKKQLVHYAHSLCRKYCEQKEITFNENERCNIVERFLNL